MGWLSREDSNAPDWVVEKLGSKQAAERMYSLDHKRNPTKAEVRELDRLEKKLRR